MHYLCIFFFEGPVNKSLTASNKKDEVRRALAEAQSGNQRALDLLRERYRTLIENSARRFCREGMSSQDREDILEEALINFCGAVCSYDLTVEGVEFGLYAKICIENALVSFMRSFDRRRRISVLSLDEKFASEEKKDHDDLLGSLAEREQAVLLARRINVRLSKYEKRIWWMYVSGLSVREIAKSISVEPKSVSNAIYRIRRKLSDVVESAEE